MLIIFAESIFRNSEQNTQPSNSSTTSSFGKLPMGQNPTDTSSSTSSDFILRASVDRVSVKDKILVHNGISASTGMNPLLTAKSIGPKDPMKDLDPTSLEGRVARKDTKLGSLVLLEPEQFHNEVVLIKFLGAGGSGTVHEAIWRGSLVAVKVLHPSRQVSASAVETFRKEVEFMSGMRSHNGILKVLAACLSAPNMCIITELAEEGSLHTALHEKSMRPQYRTLLDLAESIASAMQFCHSQNLVHRDLKPHNILLDSEGQPKIADFGLAMNKQNTFLSGDNTALGTASYMAPEQFSAGNINERCDSYAFGCILWECITGRQPWEECHNLMQIVMAVGVERRRPPLPKYIPTPLAAIIRECWRQNPALRPSFKEIVERVRALRKEEEQALAFKAAASLATRSPKSAGKSPRPSPKAKSPAATDAWNNKWSPVKTSMATRSIRGQVVS